MSMERILLFLGLRRCDRDDARLCVFGRVVPISCDAACPAQKMGWVQKWSRCGTGIHVRHDVKASGKLKLTRMCAEQVHKS
jgi:hypothetical protein